MAALKQIDANRRNAKKSTGPKTPEGKATSSRNALKHGLLSRLSRDVVLPNEDPDGQFPVLCEELLLDWDPQSATECLLVEDLVAVTWRLRRCRRIEYGNFELLGGDATDRVWGNPEPPPRDQLHAIGSFILGSAYGAGAMTFDLLQRYESNLRRARASLIRQLKELRGERRPGAGRNRGRTIACPFEASPG